MPNWPKEHTMDATTHGQTGQNEAWQPQRVDQHAAADQGDDQSALAKARKDVSPLMGFWTKTNNDWVFNLSGLLAYNFLMSIFPILLVLLAVAGLILGNLSPATYTQFQHDLQTALPQGGTILSVAANNLSRSAGVLFVVGLVTALYAGSRLFVTIENCFGVVFRLRARTFLRQNVMAIGMLLLYAILIPVVALASIIPSAIMQALGSLGRNGVVGLLSDVAGVVISFIFACVLFAAIYIVVPNRPVRFSEAWRGTLVAGALLAIYEIVFPLYLHYALHPGNYGSVAGFAVVILVFFYYLAFILLIGAEVNSWALGQRQTAGDILTILHRVQAHDTTLGAAGPTAGQPQEHLRPERRDRTSDTRHERRDRASGTPTPAAG
jgi:membrane protein